MRRNLVVLAAVLLALSGCDQFTPPSIPPAASGPAPDTAISTAPRSRTRKTTATFDLSATVSGATTQASFQCSVDNGPFAPCASPAVFNGLAPGTHGFRAYAVLDDGRFDASPAAHTWEVITTPLDTTISSGPPSVTSSTSVTIAFASTDGDATFECSLDGAAFAACTSPASFSDLTPGNHGFQVRAVDADGVQDASPAQVSFRVDLAGLTVTFSAAASGTILDAFTTFAFQANAENVRFLCSLDAAPAVPCSSPYTVRDLLTGTHQFSVIAEDLTGNRSVPAVAGFTVKWRDGVGCLAAGDCNSGNCADGVCCNTPCTESCKSCAINRGTCSTVRNGVDVDTCSGENRCDDNGVCGPASDTLGDGFEFTSASYRFRGKFPSGRFQLDSAQFRFQGQVEATR